ncbi:MAG TPA: hypothetical protein PKA90_02335 [Ignavibacteria bacterium]|mgnify:CR=1 FL=1|nr:hypothetical protein [Ignavibacteria bacterium]HMR39246.1 hypothetical protein [Ignavibacteria bacterium]
MSQDSGSENVLFEKRWPVGLTVIIVLALLTLIPERVSILPLWVGYVIGVFILVQLIAIGYTKANHRWIRIENYILGIFLLFSALGNLSNLQHLVVEMLLPTNTISGLQLLASSISIWIQNILMFSLLYWQIDRGGPESRINYSKGKPDWLFPQDTAPEEYVRQNWNPVFVDYLYLGYSTSTAFSTTDVIPITSRAKLLMMLQSFISLVVIVVVGARAINILGS